MQFLKVILITSVMIGLLSIVLHELSPKYMTSLFLSFPSLKTFMVKFHSALSNVNNKISFMLNVSPEVIDKSNNEKVKKKKKKLFTVEELKKYDGKEGSKGLYLALLGLVFNVQKGKQHYGPGGGYEFFAGRDASRAFISGEFNEEGLSDDISGLSSSDYIGLDEWMKFYKNDYKYVGKVIGRYYDENGEPTSYHGEAQKWIAEAFQQKEGENQEKKMFPPCNSEWTASTGSRLWCTKHRSSPCL